MIQDTFNDMTDNELIDLITSTMKEIFARKTQDPRMFPRNKLQLIPPFNQLIKIDGVTYAAGIVREDEVFITGMNTSKLYRGIKIYHNDKTYRLLKWMHYHSAGTQLYVEEIK